LNPSGKNYKRIVIKIGSSLFYKNNELDLGVLEGIIAQVVSLLKEGFEVVIVSSGAIALGMHTLHLGKRPKLIFDLQAAAAVGQNELMHLYNRILSKGKYNTAQVLLTWEDCERKRYIKAKNTLLAILKHGAIPIVNENDTVSTDEIRFGDNDQLSALVASLVCADLLIILSDIDGLMDKEKKSLVRIVDKITPQIRKMASGAARETSVGGMVTKIEAAKIAVESGIPCVIANGRRKDIILSVVKEPQNHGTLFLPKKGLRERQRWIAFGTKPKGKIKVDDGAKNALLNKKSLLCVGVVDSEGSFETGEVVGVVDKDGCEFARGKIGVSSQQLHKIKGRRFEKEIIHCDNIVIL